MNILGIFRRGKCCASHVKKIVLQHGLYCIIEHFINWRCTKHGCLAIKYFWNYGKEIFFTRYTLHGPYCASKLSQSLVFIFTLHPHPFLPCCSFFFMTAKEFYQASAKSFKKIYDLERFFIFTIFDKRNQFFGQIFSNQSITSVTFWLHFSETTCLSSENSHFKFGNRFDREPTSRRQDCSFIWRFRASGFWE